MSPSPPDLYAYIDFRAFLRDWQRWRGEQRVSGSYSLEAFARDAGMKRGSIANILSGRRHPTEDSVARFVEALSLGPERERFFRLLVGLAGAEETAARAAAWTAIVEHPRFRLTQRIQDATPELPDPEDQSWVGRWLAVVLRELASEPGFTGHPADITPRLAFAATDEEVAAVLERLVAAGFLVRDEAGVPRPAAVRLMTSERARMARVVETYHRDMLHLAERAMEELPWSERYTAGVSVRVPAARFRLLEAEVVRLTKELLAVMEESDQEAGEVFQISVHLFPLTRSAAGGGP